MNYLVTGGAGFIGSHLVDQLLKEDNKVTVVDGHNNKVTVIDNFSHGKYTNLPSNNSNLRVFDVDILGDIGNLFEGIDVVFHLAALTRPQWSILHVSETDQVNVHGTVKVLEHCRDNKVKRVVFMSSSNLYGENVYPTPEDAIPNPMNPYALQKFIGEQYCRLFEQLYGLEFNAIRPFNAYGTRMPLTGVYTSAVATFIDVLKNNLPLQMFGDGNQRRDFVYIEDIVDQMILMAHSTVHGEAFNCGSGTNTSINELLQIICNLIKKDIVPNRAPSQFEPTSTLADISKAERLLGWKPKISLEEGLRRTING